MPEAESSPLAQALCAVAADIAGSMALAREHAADVLALADLVGEHAVAATDRERLRDAVKRARRTLAATAGRGAPH